MRVAVGASGGKDSTVLAYTLKLLNQRLDLGLQLYLLSVDEGIRGYRDDSLATVEQNRRDYQLPLLVVSYAELFQGWTMDRIVPLTGLGANCSFCGVLRRTALELGARKLDVDVIATGHNADDLAETLVLNVLRGDVARLPGSVQPATNEQAMSEWAIPRIKPFQRLSEKEIVLYAYFRRLHYFSTECTYAPGAFRGHARHFIKDLERLHPQAIGRLIDSGEYIQRCFQQHQKRAAVTMKQCPRCQCVCPQSAACCRACDIVDALNDGDPMRILRKGGSGCARADGGPGSELY